MGVSGLPVKGLGGTTCLCDRRLEERGGCVGKPQEHMAGKIWGWQKGTRFQEEKKKKELRPGKVRTRKRRIRVWGSAESVLYYRKGRKRREEEKNCGHTHHPVEEAGGTPD